jgi:hypothetical protein
MWALTFEQGRRIGGFAVEGCINVSSDGLLVLAMPNMLFLEMKVKSSSLS